MKTKNLVLAALCASFVATPAVQAAAAAAAPHSHDMSFGKGLYTFAAAFVASTIAYKLFGEGLDSSKELAKAAEGSIEKKLKLKSKKSPAAKDVLKNIAEKGLYLGVTIITAAILKQQLGFDLNEKIYGCSHNKN